eukprot:2125632-Amphidinium_carterae.1
MESVVSVGWTSATIWAASGEGHSAKAMNVRKWLWLSGGTTAGSPTLGVLQQGQIPGQAPENRSLDGERTIPGADHGFARELDELLVEIIEHSPNMMIPGTCSGRCGSSARAVKIGTKIELEVCVQVGGCVT